MARATDVTVEIRGSTERPVRLTFSVPAEEVNRRYSDDVRSLPVRGFLGELGIEMVAGAEPAVDVERPVPVVVEPKMPAKRGVVISKTAALITDKDTGKYAHRSAMRDELVRSLAFATEVWGDIAWDAVDESHWVKLLRRRCEVLIAKNCKAVRATEITISRLVTTVGWLRDTKRIGRDSAQWPRDWKKQIAAHWKATTNSDRDQQPNRARYTLDEFQRILAKATFDPRLDLLFRIAVGLRPGQVARARRSDLKLPVVDLTAAIRRDEKGNDLTEYGTLTVHGSGKKRGGVVDITRGQRRAVDAALTGEGYLAAVEAEYQTKSRADYRLFPRGYVVGRVGMLRGQDTKLTLSDAADFTKHITSSWSRKNWRKAEELAGVEHLDGRCTYAQRRLTVDVGVSEGLSPSGIQGLGLWADADMPLNVYADEANSAGRREARPVRAVMLGESDEGSALEQQRSKE